MKSGVSGKEIYRSGKLLSLKEANLGKTCFLGHNPITFGSTFGAKFCHISAFLIHPCKYLCYIIYRCYKNKKLCTRPEKYDFIIFVIKYDITNIFESGDYENEKT